MDGDDDCVDIPADLIFRILLLLPVSTLLRSKSVCKSWLSLIESSDFVHQHFDFSSNSSEEDDNITLIMVNTLDWRRDYLGQQLSLVSVDKGDASQRFLDFPVNDDPFQFSPVELVGCCKGIICLRQHRSVCLWNPATQQTMDLPPLWWQPSPFRCSLGFGFDAKTNDYKVVCINGVSDPRVCVFSLKSDSWKIMDSPPLELIETFVLSDCKTPYRNATYCWLGYYDDVGTKILTFDFSEEVFGTLPLPVHGCDTSLFILREDLACISILNKPEGDCFEVWTLNDYGVKEDWTKLYSVESCSIGSNWRTWFSKNGDFLLMLSGWQLCSYDVRTHEMTNLHAQCDGSKAVMYLESLVSLERGNGAANSMNSKDWNMRLLISKSMSRENNCWHDFDIPKVLVFRILLWLPVVSLLRFKSVCKSWCTLIKSSDFENHHLLRRRHPYGNDNVNLIIHNIDAAYGSPFEDSSSPCPYTSYSCLLSANKFELLDFPYLDRWAFRDLRITASFNGIICLQHCFDYGVYLWNPATRQIRRIMVEWSCCCFNCIDTHDFLLGFGFDTETNDYKLVRFHNGFGGDTPNIFQVYSLSTDSWKVIEDKALPTVQSISASLESPYGKGVCCWLALIDGESDFHVILLFDFSNEEFRTIPLPEGINQSLFTFELAVFKENIVCICTVKRYILDEVENYPEVTNYLVDEVENCPFEVWMMNEYGIKESWTKLYTGRSFPRDLYVELAYTKKNGDFILLRKDRQLYEYDLVTQETKELPIPAHGPHCYQVVLYEESLVPIRRGF